MSAPGVTGGKPPGPKRRLDKARAALTGAPWMTRSGASGTPPHTEVDGFEMNGTGLYRVFPAKDGKPPSAQRLSGPFAVLAEGRDSDNEGWVLLLRWFDRDGQIHEWIAPRAMMAGEASELRGRLAAGGLYLAPHPGARQAFLEFLASQEPADRLRITHRAGWFFGAKGGAAFVLPHAVVGSLPDEQVKLEQSGMPNPFRARGTLEEWRRDVAGRAVGNRLLVLAVSMGFAAPLLTLMDQPGGGVHLVGQAQRGKSTALRAGASVWGAPDGPNSFARSWRSTANALESIAAESNDGLLALDEIGEADAREIGASAYMLANGSGKGRAQRDGRARPVLTWRLLLLSTGEKRMLDMIAEAKMQVAAGQEVRLIDMPADAGAGMGLFELLHGAANPGAFAEQLASAMHDQHGTAGPAFLQWLVPLVSADSAWARDAIRPRVQDFLAEFLPPGADGQVRSVSRRLALIAIGGELATEAGVTGWPEGQAWGAVGACLRAWVAARGSVAAREDLEAVRRVAAAITSHGNARIEIWKDRVIEDGGIPAAEMQPPHEARMVANRLGWRRWLPDRDAPHGGEWRYFFTGQGWAEILGGLQAGAVAKTLHELGHMPAPRRRKDGAVIWSRTVKPPGFPGGVAVYEVFASILAEVEDDASAAESR